MVVSLVNFPQRDVVNSLFVSGVRIVREALNFPVQVDSLLSVIVRWKYLGERVSHFHFPVESPRHVSVRRKRA